MRRHLFALSLFVSALAAPGAAWAFCDDLLAGSAKAQGFVIAPIDCKESDAKTCGEVEQKLVACLGRGGAKVVTPQALQAMVGEATLKEAQGKDAQMRDMALSFGAKKLVVTSIKGKTVLVRMTNAETGEISGAARISLDGEAAAGPTLPPATLNAALRRLTDRLAAAFRTLPGDGAKKRVAVLPFKENGDVSTKNALGTLVSAELVTRFRRDYDFTLVERARLDSVLKEMELASLGLIDEERAPRLGALVEADVIVLGSTLDAGTSIKIYAQVIDVVTGVTLLADNTELAAAGLVALSSDAVVLRTRSGALFRSLLVPGWGQLYNRQPIKGYVFIGLAIAIAGTAGAMQALSAVAAQDYLRATSNFDAHAQRSENYGIAAVSLWGTLGAFWIYNVIDAYASGTTFDSAVAAGSGSSASY